MKKNRRTIERDINSFIDALEKSTSSAIDQAEQANKQYHQLITMGLGDARAGELAELLSYEMIASSLSYALLSSLMYQLLGYIEINSTDSDVVFAINVAKQKVLNYMVLCSDTNKTTVQARNDFMNYIARNR